MCGTSNFPLPEASPVAGLGILGVKVFFVISGYLITGILLKELTQTGDIDLPKFYFRRALRLFPAAWLFITVAAFLHQLGFLPLGRYEILFAYGYAENYYESRSFSIGHLWTLAIEEQFYLLWPVVLKLLGSVRSRTFLIAVLCTAPFFRLMSTVAPPAFNFLMYSDILATGCLVAVLEKELTADPRYRRLLASRFMALLPLLALVLNYYPRSTKLSWLVGETIGNVSIAISVHWCILNSRTAVGRFLNRGFMVWVGVLSYSLYLWQQLFTRFGVKSGVSAFPINILLMFLVALASYHFVEKPFLRLRGRLESRWGSRQQRPLAGISIGGAKGAST